MWSSRASHIDVLRNWQVIENRRLPKTEVDCELDATWDAPGTARSTCTHHSPFKTGFSPGRFLGSGRF
jgi:hypothetical protein